MAGAPQEQAARQLFAELYAAADLSERQIHQIGMIVDARLVAQGTQTQNQIAAVQSRIEEASQLVGSMRVTIDGNQSDVNKTKDEIRSFMTDIDTKRDDLENRLKTAFSGHDQHIATIEAEIVKFTKDKDAIIAEITAKTDDITTIREGLRVQLDRAENVLSEQTGGWKREVQATISEMRTNMEARFTQVANAVHAAQATGTGRNFGDGNSSGMSTSLLDPRDLKMPFFPDKPENVEAFKRWIRGVTTHVSRHVNFPNADMVFNTVRNWPSPLVNPIDIGAMIDSASDSYSNRHSVDYSFRQTWNYANCDKELFDALEHVMEGKIDGVLNQCPKGCGFELLRIVSRKYDPQYKHVKQNLKAKLFALANNKCQNFNGVVKRVELIEGLRTEMLEATGEQPSNEFLAEIFVPSLDASCLTELDGYQVEYVDSVTLERKKKDIDLECYQSVREYVYKRQQRERSLVPIGTRRMDVSSVAQDDQSRGSPTWSEQEQAEYNAHWGGYSGHSDNSAGGWTYVGPAGQHSSLGDLDPMNKGKGKGKGPLVCHNCNGEGHPYRLCPSPPGAKGAGGPKCENCKGFGHGKGQCPSKGGGKFGVAPKGGGKGKGGKLGKGKGSGKS